MTDTLDLLTASQFCQLHYQTLRERAKAGEIPGACKPGKKWVFLRTGRYDIKMPYPLLPRVRIYYSALNQ